MSKQSPRLEVLTRSEWVPENDKPLIIAGPCSAESEEQVLATAHAVAKVPGVKIFRAGVWKPRTRPGDFEGHGVQALQWLKRAKEETGLLTACEVANTNHVYEALKFGVDVLWIGARTSVNPFSVQEIANALSGVDVGEKPGEPRFATVDRRIGTDEQRRHQTAWCDSSRIFCLQQNALSQRAEMGYRHRVETHCPGNSVDLRSQPHRWQT